MSQFDPYLPPKFLPPEPAGKLPYGPRPAVVLWYRVYCAVMVLIYALLLFGGGAAFFFADEIPNAEREDRLAIQVQGVMYAVIAVPLAIAHGVGLAIPQKRWGWVYGIVTIGLGLTSCCTWPATIPLLIYWLKPETKDYFGA